jgi:hypothetical protein
MWREDGPYLSADEKEIMDLALEDYTWLSDVFFFVRNRLPGRSEDEWLRVSKALVSRLIKAGYAKLYFDDDARSRPAKEIVGEEARQAMLDRNNWILSPEDSPKTSAFAIAGTPEGESAMHD